MKKKIFLICLIGLFSVASAHAKCDGGTEIKNSVGKTFCQSNIGLNWWSALSWCKANGLHLATMYEMCPSWDGNEGDNKCPELRGLCGNGMFALSSTAYGNGDAYRVRCAYGDVLTTPRQDQIWDVLALCTD